MVILGVCDLRCWAVSKARPSWNVHVWGLITALFFLILGRSAQDLCLQGNSVTSSNWTHSESVSTLNVPTLDARLVTFIRLFYSK